MHNRSVFYLFIRNLALFLAVAPAGSANAENNPSGVYEALTGSPFSTLISANNPDISAGGWATFGYSYNPSHPADHSNGPVQFNNRANELDLYQLGIFLDKAAHRDAANWDWGGRFEFMFGTDTPNTQASGHWDDDLISTNNLRYYDVALPQAYFEIAAPLGNGLNTKIGHFYSILGYESVPSPPNLFVSHSYSMKSSPFTMTGILASYPLGANFSVLAGAVTGPDNFDSHFGAWSFTGGFNWNNTANTRSFSFALLDGDIDDTQPSRLSYFYTVLRQDLSAKLRYVLQHDRGMQQNFKDGQNADWYSLVQYLSYEINREWKLGLRAEWFRDQNGARFGNGPASYYAISAGANWKPMAWLTLRPEVRYDWAQSQQPPFDTGSRSDQWLLAFDAVVVF